MSVRTSDWSSSATRIFAAALSGICSVLEKRGIDVAAAHDEHRGRHRPDGTGPERRGRGRAGRLDRDMALPPEKMYRLAQCVIFDEDHSRETVALAGEVREGDVPDAERDQPVGEARRALEPQDRKSTRLNSSHLVISYAVFCLKKKKKKQKLIRN